MDSVKWPIDGVGSRIVEEGLWALYFPDNLRDGRCSVPAF